MKSDQSFNPGNFYLPQFKKDLNIPLYISKIPAGFPSPADDYIDQTLDLNEYLISHPSATFFIRVQGDSMIGAGIHSGDILIVDRSIEAISGKIIVASLDGEFLVKRLIKNNDQILLLPENNEYKTIKITCENEFIIWGVVTYVIHPV